MILMFCIFRSLIGTDMTYHFSVDVPVRIQSIYPMTGLIHLAVMSWIGNLRIRGSLPSEVDYTS